MGLFTDEVQKTSVTFYIERLSNYEEIDWYIFQQLSESIAMQESGPREAIEAIRKRLKHGSTQEKLRVFEVLKLLVENTGAKFHRELVGNEKMRDRFTLILSSPTEDMKVRKELLSLLGTWAVKFKGEAGMQAVREMYENGRKQLGQPQVRTKVPTAGSSAPSSPTAPAKPTKPVTPPRQPAKRQSLPPPAQPQVKTNPRRSSTAGNPEGRQRPFDIEAAKPKLIHEVAVANQNINNLLNALKFVNTSEDRWEVQLQHDARLQDYLQKCEESKKKIVRYARLVEDEEWIGTLLATNEELLRVLAIYESMATGQVPAQLMSPTDSPPEQHQARPASPTTAYSSTLQDLQGLQLSDEHRASPDNLDPFADPVEPIDDIPRRY